MSDQQDIQIDTDAIAEQVANKIAARQGSQPTQVQRDVIDSTVSGLRAKGYSDEFIAAQADVMASIKENTDRSINTKVNEAAGQIYSNHAANEFKRALKRELRDYARDDELIKFMSGSIEQKVIDQFANDAACKKAREAFQRTGEVDEDVIADLVKTNVEAANKAAKRDVTQGGPTIKVNGSQSSAAAAATQDPNAGGDLPPKEKWDLKEKEVFNSTKFWLTRSGKISNEDAEKKALDAVRRLRTVHAS